MIDFSQSYSAEWRVVEVDPDTWDDGDEVPGVFSASVNKDCTDDVPLLETATIEIDTDITEELGDGWYRIIMRANQGVDYEDYPISTVLVQKSSDMISYGRKSVSFSGASVLKLLEDIKNTGQDYRYVPKGVNGAKWAAELIDSIVPSTVELYGDGFTLTDNIVFSPGVSYLSMVWKVLDSGDPKHVIMLDGDGNVEVLKRPTEPTFYLNRGTMRLLAPTFNRTLSSEGAYNRYYAIDRDGTMEVVENHDPTSPLSYEVRRRWVDYVDTAPAKVNGETLYSYVRRKLEESSLIIRTYSYKREYDPNVRPFSLIRATIPTEGLDGDLRVYTQAMTLGGNGILVDESAGLEIKGWTR